MLKQLDIKQQRRLFCFILLSFAAFIFYLFTIMPLDGNDFWWHIKAGQWMINNKAIMRTDALSWIGQQMNMSWTAHEWLSEVVFATIFRIGGELGTLLFCALMEIGMLSFMMYRSRKNIIERPIFSIIMFVLIAWITRLFCYGRPQLFSFALFILTIDCLYRFKENEKSKAIYFIPVIAILWSNFHGGSSNLVYLLCIVFGLSGLMKFNMGRLERNTMSKRQVLTYFIIAIIATISLICNPYGPAMIIYPYANIGDSLMLGVISEWRAPELKQDFLFFIPILFTAITLCVSKQKISWTDMAVFGFTLVLFLSSIRFITLFVYAMPFYICKYIPEIKTSSLNNISSHSNNDKISNTFNATKASVTAVSFILCLFSLLLCSMGIAKLSAMNGKYISTPLDSDMVEYVKQDNPQRIYNAYNFGEILVYNDVPNWIDGRADMYSPHTLYDHKMIENADINYCDALIQDKYNFDALLVIPNTVLDAHLSISPDYVLVHETASAKYYKPA